MVIWSAEVVEEIFLVIPPFARYGPQDPPVVNTSLPIHRASLVHSLLPVLQYDLEQIWRTEVDVVQKEDLVCFTAQCACHLPSIERCECHIAGGSDNHDASVCCCVLVSRISVCKDPVFYPKRVEKPANWDSMSEPVLTKRMIFTHSLSSTQPSYPRSRFRIQIRIYSAPQAIP